MSHPQTQEVLIVGTGCAGLTAAIYTARAGLEPLIVEGQQPGGQLTTTSEVENFPGFPEGIEGFDLMQRLRKQAGRFGAQLVQDKIESARLESGAHCLTGKEDSYVGKTLIVATGATPRLLGASGEKELFGGKGVATCATCDGAFYKGEEVAVVGGGDTACEEALFLTRFCSKISLIHRRGELRASKIMATRVMEHPKIELLWHRRVQAMLPGENGKLASLQLEQIESKETESLSVKACFIAIGHTPNTAFLPNHLEKDSHGYLLSNDPNGVCTSVEGVFIAGDCTDGVYRQAITAAGQGCRAAMEAEHYLAEKA